jgi:hypothetical protein
MDRMRRAAAGADEPDEEARQQYPQQRSCPVIA